MKKLSPLLKLLLATVVMGAVFNTRCRADTVDNFQIYIGKELKLTERNLSVLSSTMPVLSLDSSNYGEQLNIYYYHCSATSDNRQLKLVDDAGNTVMSWRLGSNLQQPLMSIPIREIFLNPAVARNSSFVLRYTDNGNPDWTLLASVYVGNYVIPQKTEKTALSNFQKSLLAYGIASLVLIFASYKVTQRLRKAGIIRGNTNS